MKRCILSATILFTLLFLPAFAQWELVWSDEFEYAGLPDTAKWGYDVGGGGWGNQELQYYTRENTANASVHDGMLTITALKEKVQQNNYSSARLVTKKKGDWLYGRFEIAAKLPKGKGLWPAIWMLPTDNAYGGWPKSGEIDIMENVGFEPGIVHFTIHTEAYNHSIGTSKGASVELADPYTAFVVYALEWYEDSMVFFSEGKMTFSFKNEDTGSKVWPFDKRFHLLLNIAVGGTWGGQQGVDDDICPASMIIDYVRVYKYNPTAVTVTGCRKALRQPLAVFINNRLYVRTEHPDAATISVYSINGRFIAEYSGPAVASGRGCAVSLPEGIYIAIVNDGVTQHTPMLLAVR